MEEIITLEDMELIFKTSPETKEILLKMLEILKKKKTYKIGNRFNVIWKYGNKTEVILAKVSNNKEVAFVILESGNLYFAPIKVQDLFNITEEDKSFTNNFYGRS